MRYILFFLLLLSTTSYCQTIQYGTGIVYTTGVPAHNPGTRGSRVAVDLNTRIQYRYVSGTTWEIYPTSIYTGSDTVPNGTVATIDNGITFRGENGSPFFRVDMETGLFGTFFNQMDTQIYARYYDIASDSRVTIQPDGITLEAITPDKIYVDGILQLQDLTTPLFTDSASFIVGVDSTGNASRIKLGTNLSLDGDVLNSSGGGSGGNGIYGGSGTVAVGTLVSLTEDMEGDSADFAMGVFPNWPDINFDGTERGIYYAKNYQNTTGFVVGNTNLNVGTTSIILDSGTKRVVFNDTDGISLATAGPEIQYGSGDPNGVITARVGSTYHNTSGTTGTTYWVKETGANTNTGWVPIGGGGSDGNGIYGGSDTIPANTVATVSPNEEFGIGVWGSLASIGGSSSDLGLAIDRDGTGEVFITRGGYDGLYTSLSGNEIQIRNSIGDSDIVLPQNGSVLITAGLNDNIDLGESDDIVRLNGITSLRTGTGSPEGVISAPVGSTYHRTDGTTGTTLYIKESGVGNTGWTPVTATAKVFQTTAVSTTYSTFTDDIVFNPTSFAAYYIGLNWTPSMTVSPNSTHSYFHNQSAYTVRLVTTQSWQFIEDGVDTDTLIVYPGDDVKLIWRANATPANARYVVERGMVESGSVGVGALNVSPVWNALSGRYEAIQGGRKLVSFIPSGFNIITAVYDDLIHTGGAVATFDFTYTPSSVDFVGILSSTTTEVHNVGTSTTTVQVSGSPVWQFVDGGVDVTSFTLAAGESCKLIWRYDATPANARYYVIRF